MILKFKTANIEYPDQTSSLTKFQPKVPTKDHIFLINKSSQYTRNFCALGKAIHYNSNQALFEAPGHRERKQRAKYFILITVDFF